MAERVKNPNSSACFLERDSMYVRSRALAMAIGMIPGLRVHRKMRGRNCPPGDWQRFACATFVSRVSSYCFTLVQKHDGRGGEATPARHGPVSLVGLKWGFAGGFGLVAISAASAAGVIDGVAGPALPVPRPRFGGAGVEGKFVGVGRRFDRFQRFEIVEDPSLEIVEVVREFLHAGRADGG